MGIGPMDPMTVELTEREQIRRLLADYCFFAETGQGEKWAGLFDEDGVWDGPPGHIQGRRAILDFYHQGDHSIDRHRLSNTVISIDGERARALSSVTLYRSSRQEGFKFIGGGYYADALVKRSGRWLFTLRRYTPKLKPEDLLP